MKRLHQFIIWRWNRTAEAERKWRLRATYNSVYQDLREDGAPPLRAFLLATGLWVYLPRMFPEAHDEDVGIKVRGER